MKSIFTDSNQTQWNSSQPSLLIVNSAMYWRYMLIRSVPLASPWVLINVLFPNLLSFIQRFLVRWMCCDFQLIFVSTATIHLSVIISNRRYFLFSCLVAFIHLLRHIQRLSITFVLMMALMCENKAFWTICHQKIQ